MRSSLRTTEVQDRFLEPDTEIHSVDNRAPVLPDSPRRVSVSLGRRDWPSSSPLSAMGHLLKKEIVFLQKPLNLVSRIILLLGAVAIALSFFFPLWNIRLVAPQYQEGLELDIYAYALEGGNNGQDLVEINNLNHYIGMAPLKEADFVEMKWIPFALGFFILLSLRAAVLGSMISVIDLAVLFAYFALFSLGNFFYRLYSYGHNLDPKAPMTIEPFTPVFFGKSQIANFTEWSYPQMGSYLLGFFLVALIAAIWFSRKEEPV